MNRVRTYLALFVLVLAWTSWRFVTVQCSGGFPCQEPTEPWTHPVVWIVGSFTIADVLGQRFLSPE